MNFRPQDQQQQQQQLQQQQCGITSVRIIGGSAINANSRQRPAAVNVGNTSVGIASNNQNIVGNMLPQHVPISYYTHSAPQTSYFNDVLHPMQVGTNEHKHKNKHKHKHTANITKPNQPHPHPLTHIHRQLGKFDLR